MRGIFGFLLMDVLFFCAAYCSIFSDIDSECCEFCRIKEFNFMKYRNNPFNIRSGSKWLGVIGSKNGFCEFDNIAYGVRAAAVLLMQTYRKKGCFTISSIIRRYAPPVENNTEAYIRFVSSYMAFPPNIRFNDKLNYCKLLAAMARFETGTKISEDYISHIIDMFNILVFCLTPKK